MNEENTPWSTLGAALNLAIDFLVAIGCIAAIAFVVGYFWVKIS